MIMYGPSQYVTLKLVVVTAAYVCIHLTVVYMIQFIIVVRKRNSSSSMVPCSNSPTEVAAGLSVSLMHFLFPFERMLYGLHPFC